MPTVIREGVKSRHEGSIQQETNSSPEPNKQNDDIEKSNRHNGTDATNSLDKSEFAFDSCSVASGGAGIEVVSRNGLSSGASSRDLVPITTELTLRDDGDEKVQKG